MQYQLLQSVWLVHVHMHQWRYPGMMMMMIHFVHDPQKWVGGKPYTILQINFINTNKNSHTEYMSNWEGKLPSQRRVQMTQKTVLVLGATVIYGLSIFNRQLSIKCNRWSWAMPWLRWVVTGLSPQTPGSVRMGCDGQSDTVTGLSLSLFFSFPLSISLHCRSILTSSGDEQQACWWLRFRDTVSPHRYE
jgi:hypothetical protein